jgi:UDP-glucuronate 4-epimerase
MKKILVTGGAGFIGSHLCESLLRRGNQVTIADNFDPFYSADLKKANLEEIRRAGSFDFFPVDIRETARLREAFEAARPHAVIHLAARAGVRPSMLEPAVYVSTNVDGTVNLLELSRQFGVEKFIFASSSSVYGKFNRVPFSESDPVSKPLSVYAATKAAGEALCFAYSQLYPMSVISIRIFTAFGPRQRPDLAIRKFAQLIEDGHDVPIYGDGSMSRDYTYVTDVVEGLARALDVSEQYEVFNLGNSRPVRVSEMVDRLERALGKRANRKYLPAPAGEMPATLADLTKSRARLGYDPKVSFEEGIRMFVDWFRQNR